LFGFALLLPTIRSVLVSLAAIILYLTALLSARLLGVTRVAPVLPTVLPPICALRFRITREWQNRISDSQYHGQYAD
jgi:hypothetical protein